MLLSERWIDFGSDSNDSDNVAVGENSRDGESENTVRLGDLGPGLELVQEPKPSQLLIQHVQLLRSRLLSRLDQRVMSSLLAQLVQLGVGLVGSLVQLSTSLVELLGRLVLSVLGGLLSGSRGVLSGLLSRSRDILGGLLSGPRSVLGGLLGRPGNIVSGLLSVSRDVVSGRLVVGSTGRREPRGRRRSTGLSTKVSRGGGRSGVVRTEGGGTLTYGRLVESGVNGVRHDESDVEVKKRSRVREVTSKASEQ